MFFSEEVKWAKHGGQTNLGNPAVFVQVIGMYMFFSKYVNKMTDPMQHSQDYQLR